MTQETKINFFTYIVALFVFIALLMIITVIAVVAVIKYQLNISLKKILGQVY